MRISWVLIFFFSVSVFAEQTEITDESIEIAIDLLAAGDHPFFTCNFYSHTNQQDPKLMMTHGERRRKARTGRPQDSNKKAFYQALHKKISNKIEEQIKSTEKLMKCFSGGKAATEDPSCRAELEMVDFKQYTSRDVKQQLGSQVVKGIQKDTLAYNVKMARINLALASNGRTVQSAGSINRSLDPFGFKAVPWAPLTESEARIVQPHFKRYVAGFKKGFDLKQEQFDKLLERYDHRSEGKVYPNPMDRSAEQNQHEIMQSELNRQMHSVRGRHLDKYREAVNKFPIINYLTSPNPTPEEIYQAGQNLLKNARKEQAAIAELGRKHINGVNYISQEPRKLLDYRSHVEELLLEHPEYCDVAGFDQNSRDTKEMVMTGMVVAPLLVAAFFAPPVPATLAAGTLTGGSAYYSHRMYEHEKAGAYVAIKSDGLSRSNQHSVDQSRKQFHTDLAFIPVELAFAGVVIKGVNNARKAKKAQKALGNK